MTFTCEFSPVLSVFIIKGIVIFTNDEQSVKALYPIDSTDVGMKISLNNVQPAKALSPIDFIDVGIKISSNDEQLEKA